MHTQNWTSLSKQNRFKISITLSRKVIKPSISGRLYYTLLQVVTPSGFKPETPTSVVWYSIQLSYAAIALFYECKDRTIFLIEQVKIEKIRTLLQ